MTVVAGLDACRTGWVAVVLHDGRFTTAVVDATFTGTLARLEHAVAIGVDIPIGLPAEGTGPRPADQAGRRFVGPRRSSVFPTPSPGPHCSRPATRLPAVSCRRCLRSHTRCGARSSRSTAALEARVFEAHPEVSFAALAGAPMAYAKRTWNGLMERRRLLAAAGIEIPHQLPGCDAAADDVLDAAVAWTAARKVRRRSRSPDPPWRRPAGCDLGLVRAAAAVWPHPMTVLAARSPARARRSH